MGTRMRARWRPAWCPPLAARGGTPAWHRDGRGARIAKRDDREYREYLREAQRSEPGCIGRRMQRGLHHGLLAQALERRRRLALKLARLGRPLRIGERRRQYLLERLPGLLAL